MKKIKWLILNGGFAFLAYHALFGRSTLAHNLFWFCFWFHAALCALGFVFACASKAFAKGLPEPYMPVWIDRAYDISLLTAIVASGHFIAGAAWVLQMFYTFVIREAHKTANKPAGN